MSKKVILFTIGFLIVLAGAVGGYFLITAKNKTTVIPEGSFPTTTKTNVEADATYSDESGFSFDYPSAIKVSDVTPDDEKYYSKLNLVKGKNKLVISVYDAAKIPDYSNGSLVGAASLGGVAAKEYQVNDQLITVAFDSGVVYLIEGPKDGGYWEEVRSLIVSSFVFGNKTTGTSGGEAIYEEEEVIE